MSIPPPGSDQEPSLPSVWPAAPSPPPGTVSPPPGYVAYNPGGGGFRSPVVVQSTAGLRKATIIMFWVVTASSAITTALLYTRRSVWDDFVAGSNDFAALDRADQAVNLSEVLNSALLISAGIVLSIWSLRFVRNAEQFVGSGFKPGLACGGWYIPIGNLWVPFVRLRAAAQSLRSDAQGVSRWQAGFIVMQLMSGVERSAFRLDQKSFEEIGGTLSSQATFSAVTLIATVFAAWFGQRAMQRLDATIAERHADVVPGTTHSAASAQVP